MSDSPLRSTHTVQVGSECKEYNLLCTDTEYAAGNIANAIYHQVKSHFQAVDARYAVSEQDMQQEFKLPKVDDLIAEFDEWELKDFKTNTYMQACAKYLRKKESHAKQSEPQLSSATGMDFLAHLSTPEAGMARIVEVCNEMPNEWTIVQLTKSFSPATTYSLFKEIHEAEGAIYFTLLRHCRSDKYPPVCLHLDSVNKPKIFTNYAIIVDRFKKCINVQIELFQSTDMKKKYWSELSKFAEFLQLCLDELNAFFKPWQFLLKGRRYETPVADAQSKKILRIVDKFCDKNKWDAHKRVLLSQAAVQASQIETTTLKDICFELANGKTEADSAYQMLLGFAEKWQAIEAEHPLYEKRYPTILIVDERLDHFHLEQLDCKQEFTRVKSLHCLWRLYSYNSKHIQHGYYMKNFNRGACLVNPDNSLPNSSRRLRGFFNYWLPDWRANFDTKPDERELVQQLFEKDCYVYAGHGSGLQFISGKQISRTRVNSVVFLFGCDSTRLVSNGLYSALKGAHNYYHAALCPTIVGTLMPALDAQMDSVAVHVLSRWIVPSKRDIMPWKDISTKHWIKTGEVKPAKTKSSTTTMARAKDYNIGSLCEILTQVQQRLVDEKIYNSCIYVCRGLPAWNSGVKPFTMSP